MSRSLKEYRVFCASPGGLQRERKAFKETIEIYNKQDAGHRGVHFVPVGWEDTLPGGGRPQAKINEEIRKTFNDPEVVQNVLNPQYFVSIAGTPEELVAKINAEEPRFHKVITDAHIRTE